MEMETLLARLAISLATRRGIGMDANTYADNEQLVV